MDMETAVIDKHGRILIPSELRRKMGWEPGQRLTLAAGDHELRILSRRQALERIREEIRKHVPPGVSLVNELLKERREEVLREESKAKEPRARRNAR